MNLSAADCIACNSIINKAAEVFLVSDHLENDKNSNNIHMQSDRIDQVNINHQSNMTLSAHSSITQTFYSIKVNDDITGEGVASDE
jgi:hypothetical protein